MPPSDLVYLKNTPVSFWIKFEHYFRWGQSSYYVGVFYTRTERSQIDSVLYNIYVILGIMQRMFEERHL